MEKWNLLKVTRLACGRARTRTHSSVPCLPSLHDGLPCPRPLHPLGSTQRNRVYSLLCAPQGISE